MARKKTELFCEEQVEMAAFARAISHPARISILRLLLERDSACCGEIVDALPLAQPTVSQHLKELREAGLLDAEEQGLKVCYTIKREVVESFCRNLRHMLCAQAAKVRVAEAATATESPCSE